MVLGVTPIDTTILLPDSPKIIDSGSQKRPQYGDRVKVYVVVHSDDGKVISDSDSEFLPVYIIPGKSYTLESIQQGLFMVGVNGQFRVRSRIKNWPEYDRNQYKSMYILLVDIDVTILEIMGEI